MGLGPRSRKSWTPSGTKRASFDEFSYQPSSLEKLKLLLWKNYKIQVRHKVSLLAEILLPLVFGVVLVIVRNVVPSDHVTTPTIYKPLRLEGAPPEVVQTQCDKIFYTPQHPIVDAFMEKVNEGYFLSQGLQYNFTGFKTETELVAEYLAQTPDSSSENVTLSRESTVSVLAGIVFSNDFNGLTAFPKDIQYKLRFPATQRGQFDLINERFGLKPAWYTEILFPIFQLLGPRAKRNLAGGLPGYYEEGFLYLQYAIDRTLARELLNSTELEEYNKCDIKLQRFPYVPYIDDVYIFAMQTWLPLIVMMSFIYPVINIAKSVVYEKEKRLKEYMKIMGLSRWLHWTAWFIKSIAFLVPSAVLMCMLLKIKVTSSQPLPVLPESDGIVLFLVFLSYIFSFISFSFFVSTLFSSANSAATAAGVLWFVMYVPYALLRPRYHLLSRISKMISCFLTSMGMSFACQIICMLEGTGAGLQWSTILESVGPDDDFSVGDCMLMMIINGIVFLVAAAYVEGVRPGEFGVPLPLCFPFKKEYWTGEYEVEDDFLMTEKNDEKVNEKEVNDLVEEAGDAQPGVRIRSLTKTYDNGKTAVKNLSLKFYEGQITAFLGHNGAGKTTTLSILSGIYPPTSGTAFINGHDIRYDIRNARSSLGLCPQYDILFDELTVEEHLQFYSTLKGCEPLLVQKEVDRMIKALGLNDKRHWQSHTLSGGMKRKLSVGLAFCAGSKTILLDEPSSGMDPGARRSTWDLIKSEKSKRTIVLSTHYMEEADVLGDRIAIMAHGELQCCGSSLFLKKKFGGGYHLIIVKGPDCDVRKITALIQTKLPSVEVDQDVGAELTYSLPDDQSHLFPDLFEEIEMKKDELRILSYGSSNTTMEEVFIRVGRMVEDRMIAAAKETSQHPNSLNLTMENKDVFTNDERSQIYSDEPPRNSGVKLLIQQFQAMMTKKIIYASRNRVLLLAQMGIPLLYLILVLSIVKNLPGISSPPPHTLGLQKYEKLGHTVSSIRCPDKSKPPCKSYEDYLRKEKFIVDNVNYNQSFVDYILEKQTKNLVNVNFLYIVGFDQRKVTESDEEYNQLVGFFNNQGFHTPPLALNLISNAILNMANHTVTVTNHPFPINGIDSLKHVGSVYTIGFQMGNNVAFGMSFLAASFAVFVITERVTRSKHIQFVSGVEYPLYWIANFVVDVAQYSLSSLGVMIIPLLFGVEDFLSLRMQLLLALLLFCYGIAVIPLMYLFSFAFSVPTSGFTRLVLFNIFTGMATILTVTILQTPEFELGKVADFLNGLFLLFPNYALGMGVIQLSTNYQLTRDCAKEQLEFICEAYADFVCCSKWKKDFLDWERVGIGKNIVFLFCSFVVYAVMLFLLESGLFSRLPRLPKRQCGQVEDVIQDECTLEDSDVIEEKRRIESQDLKKLCEENTLVLRNLAKYYGNFLAVDHLNLGVKRGECFGLLGVNGAGKTSTFKILTGDSKVSDGDAFVCSRSVRTEIKRVHEVVGYCPQFDALIDEMTGRETIQLFARLRGIQESFIPRLISALGDMLLFTEYLDKRVSGYSGGNKRKLSTAIALVGSPPIVMLDEMTTGMDPKARRHMWDAISKVMKQGTSVILTSHSMDECEALCTRLAIMVNGTFRCLGSPQQLKSKFGEGYTLIAKITPKSLEVGEPLTRQRQELGRKRSSISSFRKSKEINGWELELEELRNFIETSFPGSILKDIHPGFVHYQIPSSGITWGSIFRQMEAAKQRFGLEAYSVGQCTLEQIFLTFTKAQINSE